MIEREQQKSFWFEDYETILHESKQITARETNENEKKNDEHIYFANLLTKQNIQFLWQKTVPDLTLQQNV